MPGPFPSPLGDRGPFGLPGKFFLPFLPYFVDFALDFPEIQWYHTPQEKTSLSWYRAAGKASENGSRPYCAAARLVRRPDRVFLLPRRGETRLAVSSGPGEGKPYGAAVSAVLRRGAL